MPQPKPTRASARRPAFLDALATGVTVFEAAKLAGVAKRSVYNWRENDDAFAADWEEAYRQGGVVLEAEARRRAVDGVDEPIFYQGQIIGHVKRYSDTLLMMLLKARDPERYCERVRLAKIMRRWAKDDAAKGEGGIVPADVVIAMLQQAAAQKAALA